MESSVSGFLQQQERQMDGRSYGSPASMRSSGSSRSGLTDVEEEMAAVEEEKVYVALGKEVKEGKANLLWALENTSREKKIVIVHVHRPAQKIPMMGAWFPVNQLKESEVKAYWQLEREKVNKSLDDYLDICARCKVQAEKLVIETDDVSKGLVELIAQHKVTKLVMGAAADKHYSKKMNELRSKTALTVQQQADPSCKISFVCRGNLICMRDADQDKSRRSRWSFTDPWEFIARSLRSSDCSFGSVSEEGLSSVGLTPALKDEGREEGSLSLPSFHESEEDLRFSSLHHGLVKAADNSFTKELEERKKTEETLARERMELETLKMQSERDNAVREAEKQHQMKAGITNSTPGTVNISEFSYAELKQATLDFDDSFKIGEGGYGSVYKGFLRHTMVAIKMLNPQSMQGQSEFHQEVDVLSRVRHPNLVTLIGACPEAWALIYEFLPNGSLEDRLVCRDNTPPLSWQIRTRITAEICSALIFLHFNKPRGVVHGDLKPANILLDANFTSKLGDFGICRFLVQSNTSTTLYCHTYPKGTFAYMDPEFLTSGELTPHSDVYSFGIIILRLLTGRPALGISNKVREALGKGCLDEILDASAGGWPYVHANQLAHLGLKCCEAERKRRPDLAGEAWRVLEPMMKSVSSKGLSCLSLRSALEDNNCIPSYFTCPISQEIMKDPHVAADGFSYEAEAIKRWLDGGHETSPMTNLKLPHRGLVPNHALRSVIQQWLRQ